MRNVCSSAHPNPHHLITWRELEGGRVRSQQKPKEEKEGAQEQQQRKMTEGSGSFSSLKTVAVAALVTNGLSLVLVLGLVVLVLVLLRKVVAANLDQIAENLPKVVSLIEASELDIAVLIAVCEEKGTSAEELAGFYKEESDRKAVVERRFGAKSRLVKRFLAWPNSQFIAKGYPAEEFLVEYLNKADNANEVKK